LQRAQLAPGTTQQAVGEQFQAQRQAEIDAARQAYQDRLGFGFGGLSQYGKAAGILGPQFSASNIDVPTNLQSLLSLAGAVAGGGNVQAGLQKIIGGATGAAGGVANAIGGALRNVFGGGITPPAGVTEIPNTAQQGDEAFGYKYYSDGTVISPNGSYYTRNSAGDYVAVYGPDAVAGGGAGYDQPVGGYDPGYGSEYDYPVGGYDPGLPNYGGGSEDGGYYGFTDPLGAPGIAVGEPVDNSYYDNYADLYG
jgi:hypothetical protein